MQILNQEAVKTQKFTNPVYVGDPINIIRILNDKGAQEILVTDIGSTLTKEIDFDFLENLASETQIPFGYGGGINENTEISKLTKLGVERFYFSTLLSENPQHIKMLVNALGSSSVGVSLDLKEMNGTWKVYFLGGKNPSNLEALDCAERAMNFGVGEIVFRMIELDGVSSEENFQLIKKLSEYISRNPELMKLQLLYSCGVYNEALIDFVRDQTIFDGVILGSNICFAGSYENQDVLITYPQSYSVKGQL